MDRYRALTLARGLPLAVGCATSAGAKEAPEVTERLAKQADRLSSRIRSRPRRAAPRSR